MTDERPVLITNPGADLYGSDRMMLETVAALCRDGHRVVVAVPREGQLMPEITALGAEVRVVPTPIIRKSAMRPIGFVKLVAEVVRSVGPTLRTLRDVNPSLVLVNTITAPLWLLASRLKRRPTVCHVHEGEASASRLVSLALYLPLLAADRIIVNSAFSAKVMLRSIPALRSRSTIVYNTVRGAADAGEPRARLTGPVRLVYVGRLSERKGPHVLLEALGLLRADDVDATVDLVGAVFPGNESYEERLRQQVAANGLTDVVTFHGFRKDVHEFVRAADIIVVPSVIDEPFGNTAVEAVLAGRPLVVSDCGGLREAVEGFDSTVLVRKGDQGELAQAVSTIVGDWDSYRRAAIRNVGVASEKFSFETYSSELISALPDPAPRSAQRKGRSRRVA